METKKEEQEKESAELCIICGKKTSYKKSDNITFRSGYIEGSGQLCFMCNQTRKMHKTGSYEMNPEWTRYGGK